MKSYWQEPPCESEQNTARTYCLHRPLNRPKTNIKTVLIWLLFIEGDVILTSSVFYLILIYLGGSFPFFSLEDIFFPVYITVSVLFLIIFSKRMLILMIELYQHYAPEETRRKCLLMPTCSEYALLALQKYGVIKGGYKTFIRLTEKCKGDTYYIDYP
ncbi:MAG: membrane protein insertion efficiency factor YidD [Bacteroidales bacterium]|jgi:putative component of membrane protein insertase Oxa1/YidC/SpoIIIJ protein YidD|nr:membrane protein insertion efficiency factor YidD [Bacteroidales bacterium]